MPGHVSDAPEHQTDTKDLRILVWRYMRALKLENSSYYGEPVLTILSGLFAGVDYKTDTERYINLINQAIGFLFELRECLKKLAENGGL